MYDDLARAQRQSALEWLVVNAVIPSVILTLALQGRSAAALPQPVTYADMCVLPTGLIVEEPMPGGPIPDAFPILIRMPQPVYPAIMRRAGVEGRVVLRALVTADGRVDSTSILIVQTTDGAFAPPAFQALARAVYRPARFGGHAAAAWITLGIDFTLRQE